jgi:hypothetical protein
MRRLAKRSQERRAEEQRQLAERERAYRSALGYMKQRTDNDITDEGA